MPTVTPAASLALIFARKLRLLAGVLVLLVTLPVVHAHADVASGIYPLPAEGNDLVGELGTVAAMEEDTLVLIARRHRTGYGAIRAANPAVDAWLPREGTPVTLPTWHILPAVRREGIVVNIGERRLYHFEPARGDTPAQVSVYAVSIGRDGRATPVASTRVVRKARNPSWYPPASIRAERAEQGEILPARVPPGPNNPLGTRAIYLGLPSYLIHGTNRELGIGMQVTAGCVRMYPEDIEYIYERVPVDTPVRIVHQAIKAGWQDGVLYVEAHAPMDGEEISWDERREQLRAVIEEATADSVIDISWEQAELAVMEALGLPVAVGPAWLIEPYEGTWDAAL